MTVNLERHEDTSFSSLLVDMNVLFEHFVFALLHNSQIRYKWIIKGGRNKESAYSDLEQKVEILPDITIRDAEKLIVVDSKYKTESSEPHDLNQVWIYCIALSSHVSILANANDEG